MLNVSLITTLKVLDNDPINGKTNAVATAFDDPNEIILTNTTDYKLLDQRIDTINSGAYVTYVPSFDTVKFIWIEVGKDTAGVDLKADIKITDVDGDKEIKNVQKLFFLFGDAFSKIAIKPQSNVTPVKILMIGRRT